jgi:hypothetical protein
MRVDISVIATHETKLLLTIVSLSIAGELLPGIAAAAPPSAGAPSQLTVNRAAGPIRIDGALDDAGWANARPIETWYETRPGDNIAPPVKSVGFLAYDDRALYIGLEFADPEPDRIRAPISDRDSIDSQFDYGGVILDPTGSGRTGMLLLVNPRGVQFDSINDDSNGTEDVAPDFFWDSSARIHSRGWTLELRIPFSSLSYPRADRPVWRLMLYRNYPRDFRYQFFTSTMPRGVDCFVCRCNVLVGLARLPAGGGIVLAPYASAIGRATRRDELGSGLENSFDATAGFDAKWRPNASTVIDATFNPDFSQIESDVGRIATNERFALFFPEKRPFFLEGTELLSTPLQAVYTRTMTDPQWGVRATGKIGGLAYTGLAVQDEGGGSVIIPRPESSELADQEFRSWAGVGRLRQDVAQSFIGVLATSREIDGGGHNRVAGPDVEWRPGAADRLTAQLLYSWTRTPELPQLAADWDGRAIHGHALRTQWRHTTSGIDWTALYQDIADDFRADNGFIPQVGFREGYAEVGYTTRPDTAFVRRFRPHVAFDRFMNLDGDLLLQNLSGVVSMDARWNSTLELGYAYERIRVAGEVLPRQQATYLVTVSPSMIVPSVELTGTAGQQIDFENARTGTGVDATLGVTVQPTPHIEFVFNEGLRWVDVRAGGQRQRLFTARVDRVRATYSFTPRIFIRAIAQYEVTRRDPDLYQAGVARKEALFSGSALLAFKLNWQSALYAGYGDSRVFSVETQSLEPDTRQFFLKFSYAFQR